MIYAQTLPTGRGDVRVSRADETAPVVIEHRGVTVTLDPDDILTVTAAAAAAAIIHQFPAEHRAMFNPANVGRDTPTSEGEAAE